MARGFVRLPSLLAAGSALLLVVAVFVRRRLGATTRRVRLSSFRECMALRTALHGRLGLDIGGTQLKMVLASASKAPLSSVKLTASHLHEALSFCTAGSSLSFVSSPTHRLEETVGSLAARLDYPSGRTEREIIAAGGGAHKYSQLFAQMLQVRLMPFRELEAAVRGLYFLSTHGPDDELFTVEDGSETAAAWPKPLFPCLLINMGSVPLPMLPLSIPLVASPASAASPASHLLAHAVAHAVAQGVSVVRIDSPESFTRVGGTACGGATFLGLARVLSGGVSDFDALIALAARGDASQVDKTVGDIYGDDGCIDLAMPSHLTAASFGKLWGRGDKLPSDAQAQADMVHAVLKMVVQSSVVLAKAYAASARCMDRIFFAGGFVRRPSRTFERAAGPPAHTRRVFTPSPLPVSPLPASAAHKPQVAATTPLSPASPQLRNNALARSLIGSSMASVGGRAIFCRHSEFLGALGSLSACIRYRDARSSEDADEISMI